MRAWRDSRVRVLAGILAGLLALIVVDLAFPPDLTRFEERSTEVRAADGRILRAFLSRDEKWRLTADRAAVDAKYIAYLVAYEDRRFESHIGIDPVAIARAFGQMLAAGRVVSGASTLSMQTARLLEPGAKGIGPKLKQMIRALQLERRFSKTEILDIYLTLAPFGGNIEGIRAASIAYLGKEPATLTAAEAALLVALPQSPERLRPDRSPGAARDGRNKVLRRLHDAGLIDAATLSLASEAPVPKTRSGFPFRAPQFAETMKAAETDKIIRTGIDYELQGAIEQMARAEAHWFADGASIAIIAVDNETRRVIAYLGGLDYWGPSGQIDLARAVRSPGSALKPFIYGMGFDELPLHPETLIVDEPLVFGDYAPENFDKEFQGMISVRDALQMSLNVPAVTVLDRLGPVRFASLLERGGAHLGFRRAGEMPGLPIALGGVGISLQDLTTLYAAIPMGGVARPLRFTDKTANAKETRILSENAAFHVADILTGSPMPDGWSRGRGVVRPRTIGFKTGTSYGYRDAWSLGFSPRFTVGIWVGRPDGSARAGLYGRNVAAPLLFKVFDLLPAEEPRGFARPPEALAVANRTDLPAGMQLFLAKPQESAAKRQTTAPQIAFPPNGATLSLSASAETRQIELKVSGGARPMRWLVNGRLLPAAEFLQPVIWSPEGPGFARIVVVDAYGRSASADIRVLLEDR